MMGGEDTYDSFELFICLLLLIRVFLRVQRLEDVPPPSFCLCRPFRGPLAMTS